MFQAFSLPSSQAQVPLLPPPGLLSLHPLVPLHSRGHPAQTHTQRRTQGYLPLDYFIHMAWQDTDTAANDQPCPVSPDPLRVSASYLTHKRGGGGDGKVGGEPPFAQGLQITAA